MRSAEKKRVETCSFADEIATLVIEAYKQIIPDDIEFKQTVLSGIVLKTPSTTKPLVVLSVGVGTKVPYINISDYESNNNSLSCIRDCHAEILARRGFLKYLYQQAHICYHKLDYESTLSESKSNKHEILVHETVPNQSILNTHNPRIQPFEINHKGLLQLKSDYSIHLYTSSQPCGNATIKKWIKSKKPLYYTIKSPYDYPLELHKHEPIQMTAIKEGQIAVLVKKRSSLSTTASIVEHDMRLDGNQNSDNKTHETISMNKDCTMKDYQSQEELSLSTCINNNTILSSLQNSIDKLTNNSQLFSSTTSTSSHISTCTCMSMSQSNLSPTISIYTNTNTNTNALSSFSSSSSSSSFSQCTIPPPGTAWVSSYDGHIMTCSDKIAKWNTLGIQGCLLSNIYEPIYLSTITVGRKFCQKTSQRALCCRLKSYNYCVEIKSENTDIPSNNPIYPFSTSSSSSFSSISSSTYSKGRIEYHVHHPAMLCTSIAFDTSIIRTSSSSDVILNTSLLHINEARVYFNNDIHVDKSSAATQDQEMSSVYPSVKMSQYTVNTLQTVENAKVIGADFHETKCLVWWLNEHISYTIDHNSNNNDSSSSSSSSSNVCHNLHTDRNDHYVVTEKRRKILTVGHDDYATNNNNNRLNDVALNIDVYSNSIVHIIDGNTGYELYNNQQDISNISTDCEALNTHIAMVPNKRESNISSVSSLSLWNDYIKLRHYIHYINTTLKIHYNQNDLSAVSTHNIHDHSARDALYTTTNTCHDNSKSINIGLIKGVSMNRKQYDDFKSHRNTGIYSYHYQLAKHQLYTNYSKLWGKWINKREYYQYLSNNN